MFLLVILAYGMIGFLEITPLVKKRNKKEIIIYSAFFSLAFILSLLLSFGFNIPSPAVPIENIVNWIIRK